MNLLPALSAKVTAAAHPQTGEAGCTCGTFAPLADRPDATVVRHAGTVAKAHAPGTDPAELSLRLATAARLPDVLLPPLTPTPTPLHDRLVTFWPYGTPVDPDDPDAAPWEAAATLLARLHNTALLHAATPLDPTAPPHRPPPLDVTAPLDGGAALHGPTPLDDPASPDSPAPLDAVAPLDGGAALHGPTPPHSPALHHVVAPLHTPAPPHGGAPLAGPTPPHGNTPLAPLPPMRGPTKAARAVGRLRAALRGDPHEGARPVLRAWAALPGWARAEAPMPGPAALCHGDLHLGQLVRHPAPDGPWRLIDVDDLGVGVPAWDLARPAAWYACGLLPPDEWSRFLSAYRRAAGPAVPPDGDPWPALDVPARALTVQTAAAAVTKALAAGRPLDEVEQALVDACDRMTSVPAQLTSGFPD
ncbi:phosphotransferase [Streptomyces sp. NPDC048521]|uniref:phosphotransferase family protein n=1 Tax=Streptomyces sp. NPDC048521 TaxID=3365566 RepID=UPI00371AE4C6